MSQSLKRCGKSRAAIGKDLNAAVSFCSGSGAAAIIMANHGSLLAAITIIACTQIATIWLLHHQMALVDKYWRLYEDVARARLNDASGEELSGLLRDIAATHPAEIGERIFGGPRRIRAERRH